MVNAIALARIFVDRRWDVHIVAIRAEGALRDDLPEAVTLVGLSADDEKSSRKLRMRRSIRPLRAYLRRTRPDVLLSVGNQGHAAAAFASTGLPTRLAVRISNDLRHSHARGAANALWSRLKFAFLALRAARMIFVSNQLRDAAVQLWPNIRDKAEVIPNGVDVASVQRGAGEAPMIAPNLAVSSAPLVVAVGRLVEQKNHAALIDALAVAAPTHQFRLLIVGSGPLEASLTSRVQALGLTDSVAIVPAVPNPLPYLAMADVVALPSLWEGASNVLLEAVALNRPVVASATAGNAAEVLGDGRFGVLADPKDPHDIARGLIAQSKRDAVMPGRRALDYSRSRTLEAYACALEAMFD